MTTFFKRFLAALALVCCGSGSAAVLSFSGTPGAAIPDDNAVGLGYHFTVSDPAQQIASVTVSFAISGGYNGDIYAYLSHGDGFAVLLNRVGVTGVNANGYPDNGFNVTLTASGNDIHDYRTTLGGAPPGGILTGSWAADGRLNATDVVRNNTLSVFNGLNPNGEWVLFFADRAAGSIGTLDSWAVDIEPVPEPIGIALGVFAALFAGFRGARFLKLALKQRGDNRGN